MCFCLCFFSVQALALNSSDVELGPGSKGRVTWEAVRGRGRWYEMDMGGVARREELGVSR